MTTSTIKWILASASPRRREILDGLGLRFRIRPSVIPEPERRYKETPTNYVLRAARLKSREVGCCYKSGMVIGADTIVVARDHLMGKPATRKDAAEMLRSLSGGWHEVITGVCLFDCRTGRERSAASLSRVHFRRISPAEIEWYLNTGEYKDKAGAYGIQGRAALFIDQIEGCYFNIVGFPVATFERLCRRMGITLAGR